MAIGEVWVDIFGFDGKYQISNTGRVRSKNKILKVKLASKRSNGKNSYVSINLYVGLIEGVRKFKTINIHREVARHFLDDFSTEMTVNHKDGNRNNNFSSNLEMSTNLDNTIHGYQTIHNKKRWGVYKTPNNTWIARIKVSSMSKNSKIYLGCFPNEEAAYSAYKEKYLEIHGVSPW